MLEYELVDANEVCQGIQKVRVEPATRSAVATRNGEKIKIKKLFVNVSNKWFSYYQGKKCHRNDG